MRYGAPRRRVHGVRVLLTALVTAAAVLRLAAFQPSSPIALSTLTVPSDRLPAGCALAPAASERAGNRMRVEQWGALPIDTNPWTGTSRQVIATIRERTQDAPRPPDGPPLDRRATSRYAAHLADGVDEGYAAFYLQPDSSEVVVYAVRLAPGQRVQATTRTRPRDGTRTIQVEIGPVAATVFGDGGPCFQAIGTYLTSLPK